MDKNSTLTQIENRIFTIRGVQVMLDRDLAELYNVETRSLNQAVKRNQTRFPERYHFQLTQKEFEDWKSQIVISKEDKQGLRRPPFAFTEQGVAMLSAVLNSETAVRVSIQVIDAFIEMRKMLFANNGLLLRMDRFDLQLAEHDEKFRKIFKAIESKSLKHEQGIFFDGQLFDAYTFVSDIIRSAQSSIVLIDSYVDDTVLTLLLKRNNGVMATIYTPHISKQLQLDLAKHNQQYHPIEVKTLSTSHDRFLIIDRKELYHIGASLKDLGKKWFAFSKMDLFVNKLLAEIE